MKTFNIYRTAILVGVIVLALGSAVTAAALTGGTTTTATTSSTSVYNKSLPVETTDPTAPHLPPVAPPGAQQDPSRGQSGISYTVGQGPFSSSIFSATSVWWGPWNGQWYEVWAGEYVPSSAGAVWVNVGPIDQASGPDHEIGRIMAPNSPGSLKITQSQGQYLTIQRQDGTTISFNLATETFS